MRAFDEAIERIEEINIPNELIPVFVKTMQRMSSYFDSIGDLRLDFDKLFHNRLYNNRNEKINSVK